MKFEDTVLKSYPTGSRYICNPPPMDTDNDTVMLVNGYYDWRGLLKEAGWENCGKQYDGSEFGAYRKGEENYIVTEDPAFFDSYVKATEGAKALNLLKKEDRIALFQAVQNNSGEGAYDGFCVRQWDDKNKMFFFDHRVEGRPLGRGIHEGMKWREVPGLGAIANIWHGERNVRILDDMEWVERFQVV